MSITIQDPQQDMQPATVSVHALSCGHFTLPEHQFVQPVSHDARKSVPSLAFLIEHRNSVTAKVTRILFDLGLRKDVARYTSPIQQHIKTRQPMTTESDVIGNLLRGGLSPNDIDLIIYSHVHWDHVGEPRNFSTSKFSVGYGTLDLLSGASSSSLRGSHSFFEHDLLPESRSIELSDPFNASLEKREFESAPGTLDLYRPWVTSGILPQTLDVFGDSSLLIVNAPGHLPGHINLLAQTPGGHQVYMAGDAFHDRRLLTGEKSIGEWEDTHGQICCIHADRKQAEETIARLRQLQQQGVEIISAHDPEWENDPANRLRFFGVNQS